MERRFFIRPGEYGPGDRVRIDGDEGRHLSRVLRLVPGDPVELLDGAGRCWRARIDSVAGEAATVRVETELPARQGEPSFRIELIQALPKAAVFDAIVRRATELGVAAIHPVTARRSPPAGSPRGRVERWRRIAREAVKQCRRSVVPRLEEPRPAEERLQIPPAGEGWILHPEGDSLRRRLAGEAPPPPSPLAVAVGPEGGWEAAELERAVASGFHPYRLGSRILRVETASLLFVALARFFHGDPDGIF